MEGIMNTIKSGLIVAGGGCGGFATAVSAARENRDLKIILIEKNNILGGNSTIAGVNCWEPGTGGESGLHRELAQRLLKKYNAAGVGRSTHHYSPCEPWSMSITSPVYNYEQTLQRAGIDKDNLYRFHYEPYIMAHEMDSMLRDEGVEIYYNTVIKDLTTENNQIKTVICSSNGELIEISGDYFADCTGDIVLSKLAGCKTTIGQEGYEKYKEPGAPDEANINLNGATLVFRVEPSPNGIDPLPEWVLKTDEMKWMQHSKIKGCSINEYPNKDLNMNILPVLEGFEYWFNDKKDSHTKALARILLYWNYYQEEKGFDNYTLKYVFPIIGIRESHRLVGRYILTLNDIIKTYKNQNMKENIIAFSDHPVDVHGNRSLGISELNLPYGIPYESLLPNEYDNLIIACRGASFTHIASASCRLIRVMMACGEAAGKAAALAFKNKKSFADININDLKRLLKIDDTIGWIERRYN